MHIPPTAKDQVTLHRLFGWHTAPWVDAFSEALKHLDRPPASVLEIGASRHSAPSLFFLSRGATVEVTCHAEDEVEPLRGFCEGFCKDFQLSPPVVKTHDIVSASNKTHDLILLKGVLGGLDRTHDLGVPSRAVENCLDMLNPGGRLLILDKGWCSAAHTFLLRNLGKAGRKNWHYFSERELGSLTNRCRDPRIVWKGFLNIGVMPFMSLQRLAGSLDRAIFDGLLERRGTVFAAVYRNDHGKTP